MATTFTIVAVFMPVAFMGGMVGQVLLRVRHHGGGGGAGLAVRQLHARPDAVARAGSTPTSRRTAHEGRRRQRAAALQPLVRRPARQLRAAARLVAAATARPCSRVAVVAFLASFPDPRACWAATSCPTSTAASTRSPSRRRRGRRCGRRASARARWSQRLKTLPDVEYTYTTIGEAGTSYRPVTEGAIYVKLKPRHRQDLQPGAARGARSDRAGARPHLRAVRGGAVRPEADPDQRARTGDRRARPHLARADGGDVEDPGRRRHRDQPREVEARAAGATSTASAPAISGVPAATSSHRRCGAAVAGAGGDRRSRTRRATATTCACGCGPTSAASPTTCSSSTVPTDKDDDERRQDAGAAARAGDGASPGTGPSTDPPQATCVREVRVSANPDGRASAGAVDRHRAARGQLDAAARLRHRRGRRHRRAGDHVRQHVPGAVPGGHLHLPDPGLAVRLVHAAARHHAVAAAVARRRGGDAATSRATRSTS